MQDVCPENAPQTPAPAVAKAAFEVKVVRSKREKKRYHIRVDPPKDPEGTRAGTDVCCVIDISASMGAAATTVGESGETQNHGLNLLDVAKHGVKAVAHTLKETDRLAIVQFDNNAEVFYKLGYMTEDKLKEVDEQLDKMCTRGSTNIWGGLEKGIIELKANREAGRLSHIMLLTDGMTEQRDTVLKNLQENLAGKTENGTTDPWSPCTITTFGFGYSIDSPLLSDIACEVNGSYSFIPDAGFVGTCFVNTLSNVLSTVSPGGSIKVKAPPASTVELIGCFKGSPECRNGELEVDIGAVQFGQSRSFIVEVEDEKDEKVAFSFDGKEIAAEDAPNDEVEKELTVQHCRCRYVDDVRKALGKLETQQNAPEGSHADAAKMVMDLSEHVAQEFPDLENLEEEDSEIPTEAHCEQKVSGLKQDIDGQTFQAVEKPEYFRKWGKHYLPSIRFAHSLQQCNNFKDPGVQFYGGKLFKNIQNAADDAFNKLPPPKASNTGRRSHNSGGSSAPVNMAAFNNRSCG